MIMSMKKRKLIGNLIITVFLSIIAFIVLIPLLYTVFGSFKSNAEMLAHPEYFFPKQPTLENYKIALKSQDFNIPRMTWNSLYYSVICTLATLVTSSMAGYVFARHTFPGKKVILVTLTAMMFIVLGGITIYPQFEIVNLFNLGNSLWGLILIKIFGINIVGIMLIKSYVTTLPLALDESAEIDGCNFFQTYYKIILPLLTPILATLCILSFNGTWNDYILPSIFTMSRPDQRPLIAGVIALKNTDEGAVSWNLMLAGSVVSLVPVLIVYVFGNKYIVSGLSAGAVKG